QGGDRIGEVLDRSESDPQTDDVLIGVGEQPDGDHDCVENRCEDEERRPSQKKSRQPHAVSSRVAGACSQDERADPGDREEGAAKKQVGDSSASGCPVACRRSSSRWAPSTSTIVTSQRNSRNIGSSSGSSGASMTPS